MGRRRWSLFHMRFAQRQSGKFSLTPQDASCSCPVHVRRGTRPSPPTQPFLRPARPGPRAHRLRPRTRRHDPPARLHRPRPRHNLLRHRRCRVDPRTHLPRPAPRQRARSEAPPQRRPPGRGPPRCFVPRDVSDAARTPASHRALQGRSQRAHRTPADPGADRRQSPPPADRRRHRRHLP